MSFNEIISRATCEGLWRLQETSGSVAEDDSGNDRDGTITGATVDETGPNNWLPKAFDHDGVDDWTEFPTPWLNGSTPLTFVGWCWFVGDANFLGNEVGAEIALRRTGGVANFVLNSLTGSNDRVNAGAMPLEEWVFMGGSWGGSGGTIKCYNNTTVGSVATTGTHVGKSAIRMGRFAGTSWPIIGSGLIVFSEQLTDAEVTDELRLGPEPNYVSGATFTDDGAFNVGTWALPSPFASGSNGTVTYEWIVANAAGTVVASGTGSSGTPDISSESGNTVYLLVRSSNTGGYDVGDKATRTSGYGSADDGYYEIANVVAAGGGGGSDTGAAAIQHYYRHLLAGG